MRLLFGCIIASLSRDVGNLDETPPGPTRGIVIVVEVNEAFERGEPIIFVAWKGGWRSGHRDLKERRSW